MLPPCFYTFCMAPALQPSVPCMTPTLHPVLFAGLPALHPALCRASRPATRRPLLKKGSIRKLFRGQTTSFQRKGEESEMPEPLILGNRSMDTVRRPLCGCFVLSCMVGGIFRKPLGFRRCLPPARPEKAWPFQAGRSPCTKHPRLFSFAFTHRKKFLRIPRGVFSKTHLGREWDSVPQRESEPAQRGAPFQAGRSPCTKRPQTVRLGLYTPKKFLRVPRGVFSKTLSWQGVGQRPTKRERAQRGTPFQAGRSPCTKHPGFSGFAFTNLKSF